MPFSKKKPQKSQRRSDKPQPHRPLRNREEAARKQFEDPRDAKDIFIWGRHPVAAFLKRLGSSPLTPFEKRNHALHIIVDKASGAVPPQLLDIIKDAELAGVKLHKHSSEDDGWPRAALGDDVSHQRVCLKISEFPKTTLENTLRIVEKAKSSKTKGCIGVVVDQIQDPRNFGAILRSAAFFGARFVIYGKNRQADVTPLVLKSSAGGAFEVDLVPVVNIARSLEQLKEAGAWIVGSSLENSSELATINVDRPFVVVLGNEQKGQRVEVTKQCDFLARIPGGGPTVDSLNVSVAAGILLNHFAVKNS